MNERGRSKDKGVIGERGRIVIPKEIRERYGLKPGDQLHFIDYGGVISIVPASKDPIKDSSGMLKGKTSIIKGWGNAK